MNIENPINILVILIVSPLIALIITFLSPSVFEAVKETTLTIWGAFFINWIIIIISLIIFKIFFYFKDNKSKQGGKK